MIVIGMFFLGALSGLLLAWSSTPIVSAMAPLLFGLAAAGSTLLIGRADPESRVTRARLRLIGLAMTGLCCGCILTLVSGVYVKYQVNSGEVLDLSERKDIRQAIVLRAKLQALGASPKEIAAVLAAPATDKEKVLDDAITLIGAVRVSTSSDRKDGFPGIAYTPPFTGPLSAFRYLFKDSNGGASSDKVK